MLTSPGAGEPVLRQWFVQLNGSTTPILLEATVANVDARGVLSFYDAEGLVFTAAEGFWASIARGLTQAEVEASGNGMDFESLSRGHANDPESETVLRCPPDEEEEEEAPEEEKEEEEPNEDEEEARGDDNETE